MDASTLTPKQARRILEEAALRAGRQTRVRAEDILHPEQLAFVHDTSPLKAAVCSRRGGKTFGLAYDYVKTAFKHPGCMMLYLVMSRADSKVIIWPALQVIDQKFDLGLEFKENTADVVFPNGSRLLCRGIGSRREMDKLRGATWPRVGIDEAQGFTYDLRYLLDQVVEPAVAQWDDGQISMTGTPNAACAGPFYDATVAKPPGWDSWSVHRWTWRDNPAVSGGMDVYLKRKGVDKSTLFYRREYEGEWVRDQDGLVFEFSPGRNLIARFEPGLAEDLRYVLGIDVGFNEPSAFVVLAYSRRAGRAWVVESWKEAGLTPSTMAVRVDALMTKFPLETIVVDSGGLGKGYEQELAQRWSLPVQAAKKTDKFGYLQLMNGDLRSGNLLIARDRNAALIDELRLLQWDSDLLAENRWEPDRRFEDHLSDALLYGWRECRHHNLKTEHNAPKAGTKEWWDAYEEEIWRQPDAKDGHWLDDVF